LQYHFFANSWTNPSPKEILDRVSFLNDHGYESVLLTYQSSNEDYFLKAAHILQKNEKIKFMIALRPTALSPEYCAMQCAAFDSIDQNRLLLNIVSGHIAPHENTKGILNPKVFDSGDSVMEYTKSFVEALSGLPMFADSSARLVVSGSNPVSVSLAQKHADYLAIGYDDFNNNGPDYFNINKKLIVAFTAMIVDNDNDSVSHPRIISMTETKMLEKMQELESLGVTDVLVSDRESKKQDSRFHNFVKQNSF
jgi:hypothetical protein